MVKDNSPNRERLKLVKKDGSPPGGGTPPWCDNEIPHGYHLTQEGTFYLSGKTKTEEKIAGPAYVSALTRDDHSGVFGVVVEGIDMQGNQFELAFPRDRLHEQGKTLAQSLARRGLVITPGKEQQFSKYLGGFDFENLPWLRSTPRAGWLDSADGSFIFVSPNPDQGVIASANVRVIFQPEQHSPSAMTVRQQGSLEQWKQFVVEPCRGNPFLIFSLCASFAPALLKFAALETGGFHIYGRSSRGKTTCLQLAASVWGCGADPAETPESSFVQRWHTTSNALEALLAAHNDLPLVLDEIVACDAKDFGRVVYNLAGGRGKAALDRERNLRASRTWRTSVLSSGEISSRQKIEEENKKAHAGQLLRLLDIPTHEPIIADPHGHDAAEFVRQLKHACGQYFGTAGPAFIQVLVERFRNVDELAGVVRDRLDAWERELMPGKLEPEQRRTLKRFALVALAGERAIEYGVLPFSKVEIETAIRAIIRAWLSDGVNLPDSVRGVLAVQAFVQRNEARFRKDEGHYPVRDLVGYSKENFFLFTPEGFAEACHGHDPTEVARELNRRDLLTRNERDRYTSKHQVVIAGEHKRLRLYAIKADILEHEVTETIDVENHDGTDGTGGA